LNAIIHPKVIDFYRELKEKNTDETIIFDVPLLFESGIDKFCDKILVVISDYDVQLNRIVERDNIDKELASKIIKSQISNEERIKKADIVIENNTSLEELYEKVERFCEKI
ncbi:MAG: dephospho-CoA kinase, partial [Fusobacterium periodonticum]|nr:dephospho-CoA kinase [Fusobacterium periodonticum]